jgi:hypothetical protein
MDQEQGNSMVDALVSYQRHQCVNHDVELPDNSKKRAAGGLGRLGATGDQHNLLVRVVLRDLERTLTDGDANLLRDRIYAAIHRGRRHERHEGDRDDVAAAR